VLRTTVIVGFPGETDVDYRELLDLLEELRFDRVGGFTYSEEEGTRASVLPDQVPQSLRMDRLEELMDVQRSISLDKNLDLVGGVRQVLVDRYLEDDEVDPEFFAVGRTEGQALDVDGVTHLVDMGERADTQAFPPGSLVDVEIVDAAEYDLIGRVVA